MKFFNFFRGIISDPIGLLIEPGVIRDEYNGVTDPYLIELYDEFRTYRDWIETISSGKEENPERDYLYFLFKDIDGEKYEVTLYNDQEFHIFLMIERSFNTYVYEPALFEEEFISDANILLNHIRSLPTSIHRRRIA